MKNYMMAMVLCLMCTVGAFAQNYTTVQVAPENGVLNVNGVSQFSIPNYDPSEVQLEPISGSVAVPSSDQMYTVAEYASLDEVWNACHSSAVWTTNLVTLDTYSGQGMNIGYVALKFSGTPHSFGYAKFNKNATGGWTEFGYFTTGSGIGELTNTVSVHPNPVVDVILIDNAEGATISILTMNGQEVKRVENASVNQNVNVSDLSSGIYVVRVTNDNKSSMMKFVKE